MLIGSRHMVVLSLCAATLGVIGCSNHQDKASLPKAAGATRTSVRVTNPKNTIAVGASKVTGTIRSRNEATLSPNISAQILSIGADVGDRVKAGQRLVSLDSRHVVAGLNTAKAAEKVALASLDNAKRELARAEALHASGAIPDATLDQARTGHSLASAQLDQARAGIASAQQMVRDAVIVASFNGIITSRTMNVGDSVSAMPPTPIFAITDPDHLEIRVMIPEGLIGFVRVGEPLNATANPAGTAIKSKVRVIGSTIDQATRTVEVLADVVEPLDGSLRSGGLITADLTATEGLAGPFIPASAVRTEGDNRFVLVVAADKIERRDAVASVNPSTLWVKSGLTIKDSIAIGAIDTLRPGTQVAVVAE